MPFPQEKQVLCDPASAPQILPELLALGVGSTAGKEALDGFQHFSPKALQ